MTEGLVHGVGPDLVPADWPAITLDEAAPVLAAYGLEARAVSWTSPRPLSAAALVRTGGQTVFAKRHSAAVRTVAALHEEHDFADHLRGRGFPVPAVVHTLDGRSAIAENGRTWELHEPAVGHDLYREVPSWQPFSSPAHAFAAGAALARLQLAGADFAAPARQPALLVTSWQSLRCEDLQAGLDSFVAARPLLADALATRDWQRDVAEVLAPLHAELAGYAVDLAEGWTHGDAHASNLFWSADGDVTAVIDFGLADRTTPILDLATALERNTISWLDPVPAADHGQVEALVAGWQSVRPLSAVEAAALPTLLPVVHVEFALSELAYFHGVTGSPANAEVAYETYLLGHARWHAGPRGRALQRHLASVLRGRSGAGG